MTAEQNTAEQQRIDVQSNAWRKWGPYLGERQWGTVREDYSDDGESLGSFYSRPCFQIRMTRRGIEVVIQLFDIFAVVTLRISQSE
jgi:hypothetical protein